VEAVKFADVLVPTVTDEIDASVLAQAGPDLRLIANFGNGVDNIDVQAALSRGITVTNTPGVLTDDTADMTMALIMAVARRIPAGARVIPEDEWSGWSPTWMLGSRITGKRLGIVGMGGSGRRSPAAPGPSGSRSTTTTAAGAPADRGGLEATYWESLDQMLARMDIVSVNCPHTPPPITSSRRGASSS
jgi:glyoxylate reductase